MGAAREGIVGGARKQAARGVGLVSSYLRPYTSAHGVADCDDEYRSGDWDYLANEQEAPRFHVVAGYCLRTTPRPRVLELGCGEGLLAQRLSPAHYTEFLGVDAAEDAVEKARAKGLDRAAFVQADASTFTPDDVDPTGSPKRFDVIVFSEMLYYLPDPLATVRRLQEGWLAPTGEIVVSHYKSIDLPQARQVWKLLHSAFDVRLRSTLTTGDLTWTIEALAPR